jgi:transglycosylase-like protein with SLT domain
VDATVSNLITQEATRQGVPPSLALAVANHESGGDQSQRGKAGEVGVFQLLPSSFPGVAIQNLQVNIQTGVGFLRELLAEFGGDTQKALAAYNWGPPRVELAVAQYGADWYSHIPGQVQGYVSAVLAGGGIVGSIVGSLQALFGGNIDLLQAAPAAATTAVEAGIAVPEISWLVLGGIALAAYWLFSD